MLLYGSNNKHTTENHLTKGLSNSDTTSYLAVEVCDKKKK